MRRLLPLIALSSVTIGGCATARMQLDPALSGAAAAMVVSGHNPRTWNRPLEFGPFRTEGVSEGGEWRWALPVLGTEAGRASQRYRFVLAEGSSRTAVQCLRREAFVERDGLSVDPSLGRSPILRCASRAAEGEGDVPVALTLYRRGTRFQGTVEAGGQAAFAVRSVHRAEGGRVDSADPLGYTVERNGETVAAVETMNRGRVWIAPGVQGPDRVRIAAVATALLLFNPGD